MGEDKDSDELLQDDIDNFFELVSCDPPEIELVELEHPHELTNRDDLHYVDVEIRADQSSHQHHYKQHVRQEVRTQVFADHPSFLCDDNPSKEKASFELNSYIQYEDEDAE